jgi:hypothetical protein
MLKESAPEDQAKHLGAFFAPQKTGLSGGSAATHGLRPCAAADGHLWWPRPSNPLRGYGGRMAATAWFQMGHFQNLARPATLDLRKPVPKPAHVFE